MAYNWSRGRSRSRSRSRSRPRFKRGRFKRTAAYALKKYWRKKSWGYLSRKAVRSYWRFDDIAGTITACPVAADFLHGNASGMTAADIGSTWLQIGGNGNDPKQRASIYNEMIIRVKLNWGEQIFSRTFANPGVGSSNFPPASDTLAILNVYPKVRCMFVANFNDSTIYNPASLVSALFAKYLPGVPNIAKTNGIAVLDVFPRTARQTGGSDLGNLRILGACSVTFKLGPMGTADGVAGAINVTSVYRIMKAARRQIRLRFRESFVGSAATDNNAPFQLFFVIQTSLNADDASFFQCCNAKSFTPARSWGDVFVNARRYWRTVAQ